MWVYVYKDREGRIHFSERGDKGYLGWSLVGRTQLTLIDEGGNEIPSEVA